MADNMILLEKMVIKPQSFQQSLEVFPGTEIMTLLIAALQVPDTNFILVAKQCLEIICQMKN